MTDPRDFVSGAGFDALGRVVQASAPDGGVETHSYNKRDEAVGFTDAIEVTTSFVRNGFGEVIQEVSPDRGTSVYTYDAAGRMLSATSGASTGSAGQRIDYAYDIAGRLLSKTPMGRPASEVVVYAYDAGGIGAYQTGRLTSRRIKTVIPSSAARKTPYPFDRKAYRRRNVIERLFCKLKNWRRIANRNDRLAINYLSAVALVATVISWTWMCPHPNYGHHFLSENAPNRTQRGCLVKCTFSVCSGFPLWKGWCRLRDSNT